MFKEDFKSFLQYRKEKIYDIVAELTKLNEEVLEEGLNPIEFLKEQVDRVKDMVIRGGENIACIEVEASIYEHSNVLEVCVFGIPDERLGEVLCTSIYLKPGSEMSADDLRSFLADKLAAFKIPLIIEFSKQTLPKIASGKFDKPALRKLFTENN